MNNKNYKDWFELLEQNLDNLISSMDNEEEYFIKEDRQILLQSLIDFNNVKDSLIEELSLSNDMKKMIEEIYFYLNLASEDLKNSVEIVK